MTTELANYRLWCVTESAYKTCWGDISTPPIACPTNTAHTIDPTSITIINLVESNLVTINENDVGTNQKYACTQLKVVCNSSSSISAVKTWPIPVSILDAFFIVESQHRGDLMNVVIAKDTTVGVLMSACTLGSNVFNVSSTVPQYIITGSQITLTDGVNTCNTGVVTAIDSINNTITTTGTAAFNYNPYTTYVQFSVLFSDGIELGGPQRYEFAQKKIGGAILPPGIPVEVDYTNIGADGNPHTLIIYIEYLY